MSPEGVIGVLPKRGVASEERSSRRGAGRMALDRDARPPTREVGHDLRQPLAAIGALVGVVEMNSGVPPEVRHHLQLIKRELGLMGQLCQRLLDEAPDDAMRPVRLDRLASEAASSASLTFARSIEVIAQAVEVAGNELDLRRAVQNLLENACRAAGPEGTVRLILSNGGSSVRLEVHDDGPGFGGGDRGRASLGLNIVQLAAEEHGGHLEVGRSELGGARLVIVLPVDGDNSIRI